MTPSGTVRAGIGGWTFEPWEGTFYPEKHPKKRQLEYASRQIPTIEVNGTYYSTFKPAVFANWAAETPDDFVFSLKANRFATNRKVLATAGESITRFLESGVSELGPKLGPIIWQFAPTKRFEHEDFSAFLGLLPDSHGGVALRHTLEVRHPSFAVPDFVALARGRGAAICYAHHHTYPEIADVTADFVYARLQQGDDAVPTAYSLKHLKEWVTRAETWSRGETPDDLPLADPDSSAPVKPRDVFVYFIHEGKIRAPQAAMAFMNEFGGA